MLFLVTSDECVVNDIELCLGNAFGMLLMRGRLGLNPITFTFDKCFQTLARMLTIHREGKAAATERLTRSAAHAPSEHEAAVIFRRAVSQEVRRRQHLHPMFYLPVEWDEKVSGHFRGGDPSALSEEDFFNSQRIKACEAKYYQYLAKHLTKVLLVEKDDLNCKVVRHLITELLGNCVLGPVFNLFTPLVLNQWIAYALSKPEEAEAGPEGGSGAGAAGVSTKDPVPMASSCAPPGFAMDRCWAFFKSGVRERDVSAMLLKQAAGSYAIISLNDKDLFSLLCVHGAGGEGEGAAKGLFHVPFMGYTTDPSGFQICLISSEEYFPVSKTPPASVELLNGSLFLTLEQMVLALSSIATSGFTGDLSIDCSESSEEVLSGVGAGDEAASAASSAPRDGQEAEGDGEGPMAVGGPGEESSEDDDFEDRERQVLSHVSTADEDKDLFIEQERLVMLYELQGAVEEFQDALQFCENHKKTGAGSSSSFGSSLSFKRAQDDRGPPGTINIFGDKTAIRALKRFILCLEDIIFHGFSAQIDPSPEPDSAADAAGAQRFESVALDHSPQFSPNESDLKLMASTSDNDLLITPTHSKKSGFSLKTMVKRAMSTKKEHDSAGGGGESADFSAEHNRRPSLRTSAAILGMLNLLDKRYSFNWFWLEILKNSSTVAAVEKGDGGIVSSASAKLRRLSNSRKGLEDSIPAVQRLHNSWMDLFSNHLLLSIEDCQQEIVTSDSVRTCSAVDKNCLRVFLYDSIVQGKLIERISRIVRIATKEVSVDQDKKDGDDFIIPSFYATGASAVRGGWGPQAVLSNAVDISKLLAALAPLAHASVVLPPNTNTEGNTGAGPAAESREAAAETDDGASGAGAGLMSFIHSSSLLSAFSDAADGEGGGADGFKNRQRDERVAFSRRLRSRCQSIDQAWGQRMQVERAKSGSGAGAEVPPSSGKTPSKLVQAGKVSFAKVGNMMSAIVGEHDSLVTPSKHAQKQLLQQQNGAEVAPHTLLDAAAEAAAADAYSDGEDSRDSIDTPVATPGGNAKAKSDAPDRLTRGARGSSRETMRALTPQELRRQEVVFRLEMLLSGRPSLQNLIDLKIWRPVSKSFTVSVVRAEMEDDPTGLTIAGSSMQQVVVYSIAVVCRDTYPEQAGDQAPGDGEAAGAGAEAGVEQKRINSSEEATSWVIWKRYSDFDDLNKQLKLFVSSRVMLHLPLPQKQYINVGGMGSGSAAFVEKRRQRLQDYMDCVLKYLSGCDEVCYTVLYYTILCSTRPG
jgi:hypothetical protein